MDTPCKPCSRCGQTLPLHCFHRSKKSSDGLRYDCKSCCNDSVVQYRQKRAKERGIDWKPPTEKKCPRCGVIYPLSGWSMHLGSPDGLQCHCKNCCAKSAHGSYKKRKEGDQEWYEYTLHAERTRRLKKNLAKHGLTIEKYEELRSLGCAICGGGPDGRGRYAIDHDHETGKFRGLLCVNCNLGLGNFKDNPENLVKAALYLRRHQDHPCN